MDMEKAIALGLRAKVPLHLIGGPGIGKTAAVETVANIMGLHLEVLIAANRDRTDFGGIPVPDGDGVRLAHLPWVERLVQKGGILFLDEIGSAPPDVRPALLRVINERVVGDTRLPATVAVLAASNPSEWGEGEGPEAFSLAMRTRMVHLHVQADHQAFVAGLTGGWRKPDLRDIPTPEQVEGALPAARAAVAGFISRYPEALAPLPKPGQEVWGWPTPRSWEKLAVPVLAAYLAAGQPSTLEEVYLELLVGAVGNYGNTFHHWWKEQNLPHPEEIFEDPLHAPIPKAPDQLHVLIGSVVAAIQQSPTQKRWDAAWTYLRRLAQDMTLLGAYQLVRIAQEARLEEKGYTYPKWIVNLLEPLTTIERIVSPKWKRSK